MTAAIEAEGLIKTYPRGVRALDGVSFSVAPGTIFGLLGPNGAGKSTTVKILTTLSRADEGTARVAGHDVVAEAGVVRRTIGVVGQKNAVDGEATGRENLLLQGKLHGLRGRELKARVDDLLVRFRLDDAGDRFVRGYSGGMQRRLDVALGLVARPQVLFLDEPTTGLDPEVRVAMWETIEELAREEGLTILLTTHYLEEADQLASQLAIVDRGKIVVEGSPEQLKAELRGDALTLELDGDHDGGALGAGGGNRVHDALARVDGVREVVLEGKLLRARADQGARAVPAVLTALEGAGVSVAAVSVARASLDDVYLRHTGRTFEEAEAAPAERDEAETAATGGR
jgi:ABC-2 type transport system ATP-binding protein